MRATIMVATSITSAPTVAPADVIITPASAKPMRAQAADVQRLKIHRAVAAGVSVVMFIILIVVAASLASKQPQCDASARPSVLAVFDTDYTLFGLAGSVIGSSQALWAEPFWDHAFLSAPGPFGKVWGMSRGMVPNPERLRADGTLGPESLLSALHPDFGERSHFDVRFAVLSDGRSLSTEFDRAFSAESSPQHDAVRAVRGARDFNARWHILDGAASWSCYGRFNHTSAQTDAAYRRTPVQEHCTKYGHKDIMMQNILDFYAAVGAPKFEHVLFIDDQASNLRTVKRSPNVIGGRGYTWGDRREPLCADGAGNGCVYVAYPTGRAVYEVTPTGNGSWPCCCGGCTYANVSRPDEVSAFQAAVAGLGLQHFYSAIADDGTLNGPGVPSPVE